MREFFLGLGLLCVLLAIGITAHVLEAERQPAYLTSVVAPVRPSGQTIALTCARMANVDMTPGVPITLVQVQEMERCAVRMMALLR